jgi:hypothetical protein
VMGVLSSINNRSGGERGATIEDLRGTQGADFEDKASVRRVQAGSSGCGCMGGGGSVSSCLFDEIFAYPSTLRLQGA